MRPLLHRDSLLVLISRRFKDTLIARRLGIGGRTTVVGRRKYQQLGAVDERRRRTLKFTIQVSKIKDLIMEKTTFRPQMDDGEKKPRKVFDLAWPILERTLFIYNVLSKIVLALTLTAVKMLFAFNLNRLTVVNKDVLLRLLDDPTRPLITVANHRSNLDDPLLWAIFTIREFFGYVTRFRYALAAHDICFSEVSHTIFFALGQCVPVVRGEGVHQKAVDLCIEHLADKGWVHVFPEGKVTPRPIRIKWGVARMIMESPVPPIVLPIWMQGMDEVFTMEPPFRPRFGKEVRVIMGEPVDMEECLSKVEGGTELERRKAIADVVQQSLFGLGKSVQPDLDIVNVDRW